MKDSIDDEYVARTKYDSFIEKKVKETRRDLEKCVSNKKRK